MNIFNNSLRDYIDSLYKKDDSLGEERVRTKKEEIRLDFGIDSKSFEDLDRLYSRISNIQEQLRDNTLLYNEYQKSQDAADKATIDLVKDTAAYNKKLEELNKILETGTDTQKETAGKEKDELMLLHDAISDMHRLKNSISSQSGNLRRLNKAFTSKAEEVGVKDVEGLYGRFENVDKLKNVNGILEQFAKSGGKVGTAAKSALSGLDKLQGKLGGTGGLIVTIICKAIEMGLKKATEIMVLTTENAMRMLKASTTITVNSMKTSLASWDDAVAASSSAMITYADNVQEMYTSARENMMANTKFINEQINSTIGQLPVIGGLVRSITGFVEKRMELETQFMQMELQNAEKILQVTQDIVSRTDKYLTQQDSAIHNFQRSIGLYGEQAEGFETRMLEEGKAYAALGKTIKDALEKELALTTYTGRQRNFTETDFLKTFAIGKLIGEDTVATIQSQMDIFNHSVSETADIMYKTYKDINKMGLSQQKVIKNIADNLNLVNKYDFRNGTQGFIELAEWAENARFKMESLGRMVEKVQGGGFEGIITQAARLQVLGGQFAMGADPLAMLYEAHSDPAAYAKRMKNMLGGLGHYNEETGETEFNMNENLLIRAFAEQSGMSVEEAKDIVRNDNKKRVVRQAMGQTRLSESQIETISNVSTRNDNGEWVVKMLSGEEKNVAEITPEDITNIVSNDNDEALIQYAEKSLSVEEKIASNSAYIAALLGGINYETWQQKSQTSMEMSREATIKSSGEIADAYKAYSENSLVELQKQLEELGGIGGATVESLNTIRSIDDTISAIYGRKAYRAEQKQYRRMEKVHEKALSRAVRNGDEDEIMAASERVTHVREERLRARLEHRENFGRNTERAQERYEDYKKKSLFGRVNQAINGSLRFGIGRRNRIASAIGTEEEQREQIEGFAAGQLLYGGVGRPIMTRTSTLPISKASTPQVYQTGGGYITSVEPIPISAEAPNIDNSLNRTSSVINNSAIQIRQQGVEQDIAYIQPPIVPTASVPARLWQNPDYVTILNSNTNNNSTSYNGNVSSNNTHNNTGQVDINFKGAINLDIGGKEYDILGELEQNPIFAKKVAQMIAESLDTAYNGGRTIGLPA